MGRQLIANLILFTSLYLLNIYLKQTTDYFLLIKYTIIYTILHLIDDSMVPVLRNIALTFRFYMYLKEGLYTWTFQAQYLFYFLRFNFLRWRLNSRISQKIAPRRNIQLYDILVLIGYIASRVNSINICSVVLPIWVCRMRLTCVDHDAFSVSVTSLILLSVCRHFLKPCGFEQSKWKFFLLSDNTSEYC